MYLKVRPYLRYTPYLVPTWYWHGYICRAVCVPGTFVLQNHRNCRIGQNTHQYDWYGTTVSGNYTYYFESTKFSSSMIHTRVVRSRTILNNNLVVHVPWIVRSYRELAGKTYDLVAPRPGSTCPYFSVGRPLQAMAQAMA
jgi:hypothetical protein